jgi:sterol desaturase/sphingolipid hydroxylase (fatty acid hydroxylase superfamily)
MWGPVVSYLLYQSIYAFDLNIDQVLSVGIAAFVFWTFTEYVFHRTIFHLNAKSKFGQRLVYLFHGIHHDEPNEATRLVMPPVPAILFSSVFYFIFNLVLGEKYSGVFFAFFMIGYLCYDYTHYGIHHFKITSRLGKILKASHMDHHFVCPDKNFGVSSPFWDYVFQTHKGRSKNRL